MSFGFIVKSFWRLKKPLIHQLYEFMLILVANERIGMRSTKKLKFADMISCDHCPLALALGWHYFNLRLGFMLNSTYDCFPSGIQPTLSTCTCVIQPTMKNFMTEFNLRYKAIVLVEWYYFLRKIAGQCKRCWVDFTQRHCSRYAVGCPVCCWLSLDNFG